MNTMVSVAHAGGQGKSTLAQLLYLASKRLGLNHGLVAADFLDDSGHSKLGKMYPDATTEFGVGANLRAARTENNPNAAVRYWDKLGEVFMEGGKVIDMGANVIPQILDWAEDRHLKKLMDKREAPKVDFFCICKAEKHGMDDVENLVRSLAERDLFRIGKIYVVMNEVGGPFKQDDFTKRLQSAAGEKVVTFLSLPRCNSEIWPEMESNGMSIERALEMDEDQLCQELDIDLWTASAGLSELKTWFDYNVRMLRDANVLTMDGPQKVKAAS